MAARTGDAFAHRRDIFVHLWSCICVIERLIFGIYTRWDGTGARRSLVFVIGVAFALHIFLTVAGRVRVIIDCPPRKSCEMGGIAFGKNCGIMNALKNRVRMQRNGGFSHING